MATWPQPVSLQHSLFGLALKESRFSLAWEPYLVQQHCL